MLRALVLSIRQDTITESEYTKDKGYVATWPNPTILCSSSVQKIGLFKSSKELNGNEKFACIGRLSVTGRGVEPRG